MENQDQHRKGCWSCSNGCFPWKTLGYHTTKEVLCCWRHFLVAEANLPVEVPARRQNWILTALPKNHVGVEEMMEANQASFHPWTLCSSPIFYWEQVALKSCHCLSDQGHDLIPASDAVYDLLWVLLRDPPAGSGTWYRKEKWLAQPWRHLMARATSPGSRLNSKLAFEVVEEGKTSSPELPPFMENCGSLLFPRMTAKITRNWNNHIVPFGFTSWTSDSKAVVYLCTHFHLAIYIWSE